MYDIMISGYYGFKNSGDDAILMAIINNLRSHKEKVKILVLSKNPEETKKIYNVDSINRFNFYKIIKAMKKTRLFINGGGSLIQDITSTRSLYYYLSLIKLAQIMNVKVMVYANGIGPINKKNNRKTCKKVLNKVELITLREESSLIELKKLAITNPKIKITADPAITLEPVCEQTVNKMLKNEGITNITNLVAFSIREWKGHEKYIDTIANLADYMVEKYKITPVFIPMHHPKDLRIAKEIIKKMKHKAKVIEARYDVNAKIGLMTKMDLLIGMRLHALIFAASVGVPIIGLAYEPKVEGFLESVNQISAGHVTKLDYNKLIEIIDKVWENKEKIHNELQEAVILLKEKALYNAKMAIDLLEGKLPID